MSSLRVSVAAVALISAELIAVMTASSAHAVSCATPFQSFAGADVIKTSRDANGVQANIQLRLPDQQCNTASDRSTEWVMVAGSNPNYVQVGYDSDQTIPTTNHVRYFWEWQGGLTFAIGVFNLNGSPPQPGDTHAFKIVLSQGHLKPTVDGMTPPCNIHAQCPAT